MNNNSSDSKKDIECRIEALSPEKRALLELRMKKKPANAGAGDTFAIPKRTRQLSRSMRHSLKMQNDRNTGNYFPIF